MFAVTMNGDTPFVIVILEQQRTIHAGPGAPFRRHYCLPGGITACRVEFLQRQQAPHSYARDRPGRTRRSWACYWLALSMIRAMSCASAMNTRCPAGSSVTRAFIRFAMKRSSSGLIARSCVATTYHDGTVFQAGAPVSGSPSALPALGFCAVANARA